MNGLPAPGGLYDPRNERDGCGVACLARLDGVPTRETVERAIDALVNLEHRGAEGADPSTGDGAGILMQIPDAFLRAEVDFELPPAGSYGVAMCFLPTGERRAAMEALLEDTVREEGLGLLGWRDVPVERTAAGERSREVAPHFRQAFIAGADATPASPDDFERKLYVLRKRVEREAAGELALPSCSSRTVVYKGMLSAPQLSRFYTDLADPRVESALAIVHSRFSTNTFPSWELAHPFHMSAHNGEFNTLLGNVSWMRAREARLAAGPLGADVARTLPAIPEGSSDSAAFDAVLELLVQGGRSLPHAVMLMTPEAHEGRPDMPEELTDFYDYGSMLMEPWDGPASVTFTDGKILGATLDRNGLRPGRWVLTRDGWFALASEAGAFHVPSEDVERVGRLLPGRLIVVDPERGGLLEDREAELEVARNKPYGPWYAEHSLHLEDLPAGRPRERPLVPRRERHLAFGWTQEDLKTVLAPMAENGAEQVGSMGNDAALAALSEREPPLFSYFKQLFAQVTNPAIDPVREKIVMSLRTIVGPEGDLFEETEEQARRLVLEQPVMTDDELARLRAVEAGPLTSRTLDATWPIDEGEAGLAAALDALCADADSALEHGLGVLIVSDRALSPKRAAIPSLLALSSVHHHLVRAGTRTRTGIVVESGEPREPAPHSGADRLRRGGRQPLPDARDGRGRRRQGDRLAGQVAAEGDLEDGHLHHPLLQRGAGVRGRRARSRPGRPPLHRDPLADRRDRPGGACPRGAATVTRAPGPTSTERRCPTTWRTRCSRRRRRPSCPRAASTSGAATASATCGIRPRSPACSRWLAAAAPRSTPSSPGG